MLLNSAPRFYFEGVDLNVNEIFRVSTRLSFTAQWNILFVKVVRKVPQNRCFRRRVCQNSLSKFVPTQRIAGLTGYPKLTACEFWRGFCNGERQRGWKPGASKKSTESLPLSPVAPKDPSSQIVPDTSQEASIDRAETVETSNIRSKANQNVTITIRYPKHLTTHRLWRKEDDTQSPSKRQKLI